MSSLTTGLHAQQFTIEQIRVANSTKVFADGCKLQLDTLSVAYDALQESEGYLSNANETLLNDLDMCKQVAKGLDAENELNKKLLKKEVRKKKFSQVLLYSVSAVAVVSVAILVLRLP